jgi:hypothetical protein
MAKGQKRSTREIRKPKKKKEATTPAAVSIKSTSASAANPKKKS